MIENLKPRTYDPQSLFGVEIKQGAFEKCHRSEMTVLEDENECMCAQLWSEPAVDALQRKRRTYVVTPLGKDTGAQDTCSSTCVQLIPEINDIRGQRQSPQQLSDVSKGLLPQSSSDPEGMCCDIESHSCQGIEPPPSSRSF